VKLKVRKSLWSLGILSNCIISELQNSFVLPLILASFTLNVDLQVSLQLKSPRAVLLESLKITFVVQQQLHHLM